ncbi:DUF2384 domain-containing protein [Sphingomonas sp. IC-56]|uniref:antitoxin Xre/MbcA/ParS toxin-binding domain-containing protein n=1 Tax=Sphingomonas sp. IC-56 TaxID=2898529 RepID=UPI001E546F0B|nr:antitoxin Xre/MbcA/ParS toxin-binding domain-containing protein [Sphingomonas sp. IC-56]MCD2325336.1 DUF2384 domain-containing protein [Sphingomonas sp. IC-56]
MEREDEDAQPIELKDTAEDRPIMDAGEEPEVHESAEDQRPARKPFRKRFTENRLSPESAERQGRITMLAWEKLGGTDAAREFLNSFDETLGGRPLDLAVASTEGLRAVENAIAERAAARA